MLTIVKCVGDKIKKRGVHMEKKEFLDAIESFGESLADYAKKAKSDLDSVEENDLNEISEKVIKPILLIDFKSPHLQTLRKYVEWEKIGYNLTITAEAEKQSKKVLEDTLKRLNKKDEL